MPQPHTNSYNRDIQWWAVGGFFINVDAILYILEMTNENREKCPKRHQFPIKYMVKDGKKKGVKISGVLGLSFY